MRFLLWGTCRAIGFAVENMQSDASAAESM